MKVLLRRNVTKLGKIGEVVEVKSGYARNYLLPQRLAVEPTKKNLAAVEAEKQKYLEELAKQMADLKAKAAALEGKEITIQARANEEGILYGSVGPAQIVAALAEEGIFIEPQIVEMETAIRKLDKYQVNLVFADEVKASLNVWVVPLRDGSTETPETPAQPA